MLLCSISWKCGLDGLPRFKCPLVVLFGTAAFHGCDVTLGVFYRVLILLCFLCLAVLSNTGPTPMLEKRQMKLEESFPSESTPGKALDRQLDGQLNGSSCIGQDLFVIRPFLFISDYSSQK